MSRTGNELPYYEPSIILDVSDHYREHLIVPIWDRNIIIDKFASFNRTNLEVFMALSENEKKLVPHIKRHFSDESIHQWSESVPLKKRVGKPYEIDLVGEGVDGKHLLIEIKMNSAQNRDEAHKAVGQLLDYATAYMEQHQLTIGDLRLITVVEKHQETESHSNTVEKICKFLRKHDIEIEHIRIGFS